jgi:hypothetical protein
MVNPWSLAQLEERRGSRLNPDELKTVEILEETAFRYVRDRLAKKGVWVWLEGGPRPPRPLREHVRFGFHPAYWEAAKTRGFLSLFVCANDADGPDIIEDICEEISRILPGGLRIAEGEQRIELGAATPRDGRAQAHGWFHQAMHCGWTAEGGSRNP